MTFQIVRLKEELKENIIDYDYLLRIFNIYSELTDAREIPYATFKNIVLSLPNNHEIYVYKYDNYPVGLITLIIEKKLIHGGNLVGHVEDLAVHRDYKNMSIGKTLLNYCIDKCRIAGCYKLILNCNERLKTYYEKNNFVNTGFFMTYKIF